MIPAPRTFRVFVSSTFSDLKAERDALQQRVFPRLRELCAQHGARFQAIDLRWGVSQQASLDQQTMSICLREIARCQQTTPRPNFVILLGDRYGWRPLPAEIPAREFEQVEARLADGVGRTLLSSWYRRDDNAVPPVYCLQPRVGEYKDYRTWAAEVEGPLHSALLDSITSMGLDGDRKLQYCASATEQEIVHGALGVADAAEHVFCFLRRIDSLPRDKQAADFVDLNDAGKQDQEALQDLETLKGKLKKLLKKNVHKYTARWNGDGPTTAHLDRLCQDVYAALSAVILAELAGLKAVDPLDQEIDEHKAFGRDRRRFFTGRSAALQAIAAYLHYPGGHPLALVGPAGAGKSALMAEASRCAANEQPGAEVIVRFVGATPSSINGRLLLEGLCRQISHCYGADESAIPEDYLGLVEEFARRLGLATPDRPLILFIDALDQLGDADNARSLVWLPAQLPDHVHLVVSALRGESGATLERKLPAQNLVDLGLMTAGEGEALLDQWLDAIGRRLQPAQRAEVLAKFTGTGLPLYLKLAFEEARRWTSYATPDELEPNIPGMLRALFRRLSDDAQHGSAMVARALGYLAAGRSGLTEDELLDLLSADRTVMEDFRRRSPESPPVDRLPVVVWSRLYHDLEAYLMDQHADGTTTITFYHPSTFGQAVRRELLPDRQQRDLHGSLAVYFAAQPLRQTGPDGVSLPQLRKLGELPYQQAQAGLWDELRATLTDFSFLQAKVSTTGPRSLVDDYEGAFGAGYQGEDLALVQDALRLSSHVTMADPNQLAGQFVGRIGAADSPAITRLLEQVRAWQENAWLCPATPSLMAGGGPLRHTLAGHNDWVGAVAVTPDGRLAVSASDDMTLKVWDLQRIEELKTLSGHTDAVRDVAVTADGRWAVSASADETVRLWDLDRASDLRTLAGHDHEVNAVAVMSDGRRVISASADETLKVWNLQTGELLHTLAGHTDWVCDVDVTPDGRWAVSASDDETLKVWDLEQGKSLKTLVGHTHSVYGVAVTRDGRHAVSAGGDRQLKVWDLERGRQLRTLSGHGDGVRAVAVMPDGQRIVSGSYDRTVRVWDLLSGAQLRTLTGHTEAIWDLAITADGRHVLSASGDGTLRIWDPRQEEAASIGMGHPQWSVLGLSITPDGRRLVSASSDRTLKVWDLASGAELTTLTGHSSAVNGVAVTPDGRRAVSASTDKTLKVWDLQRGGVINTLSAHTNWVHDVAVTADGRRAVSASHDQSLSVWDLESGREIRALAGHTKDVTAVDVTPDGKRAVSASSDDTLIVWDLQRGRRMRLLSGHTRAVRDVAVVPDGRHAVSASEDGTLRVWDLESGQTTRVLGGNAGILWAVAVSPDGRWIASGGQDRTVRLWSLQDARAIATFTGESPMRTCAFGPDGLTLVAGEAQDRIHILRLRGWAAPRTASTR